MRTHSLTHWASLIAVLAGLLLMRIPTFACQCDAGACCVLAPNVVTAPAPDAAAHDSCCSRCAAADSQSQPTPDPAPPQDDQDEPTNCDCSCTLCKTTNPTPHMDPGASELRERPVGFAMDWSTTTAPQVQRLSLLRPPRL